MFNIFIAIYQCKACIFFFFSFFLHSVVRHSINSGLQFTAIYLALLLGEKYLDVKSIPDNVKVAICIIIIITVVVGKTTGSNQPFLHCWGVVQSTGHIAVIWHVQVYYPKLWF